eukprot:gene10699-11874_t
MKFHFCGDLDCPDWVLAEINTLSKMSSLRVKILASQVILHCLEGELNYDKVLKIAADLADGVQDVKGAVAALHFMITNAAKYDVEDNVFVQEIQQLGLPKENTDMIVKQLREHKDSLRSFFADKTFRISRLLGTDWRVDTILCSSDSEKQQEKTAENTKEKIIHLNMHIDNRPDQIEDKKEDKDRFSNLAFEMSSVQLDCLVRELSQVYQMMQNVDS